MMGRESGATDASRTDAHGRAELLEALAAHHPGDPREEASLTRMLDELSRLPRPFDRHADLVHVTGSAIVVGPRGVLLHLHRRLGRWLQPGGHVDAGEVVAEAALRECLEETGVNAQHPPGGPCLLHVDVHEAGDHIHLDVRYLLIGPDVDPAPPPGESQEVEWFSWSDAGEMADDALAGALAAARRVGVGPEGPDRTTDEETHG
jgi:8-oxo-dGTP pyrophosphatase MutT (NUDIX family)